MSRPSRLALRGLLALTLLAAPWVLLAGCGGPGPSGAVDTEALNNPEHNSSDDPNYGMEEE